MNTRSKGFSIGRMDGLLGAISAGFFLILAGTIFIATPGLVDKTADFFRNINVTRVPKTDFLLPAPVSPNTHTTVYLAVRQFCLIWGIFLALILVLRVLVHSSTRKKAESASDIVFWLGAYYLVGTFLNGTTTMTMWFAFWTTIIMLGGLSLIIRAFILAAAGLRN